jgi:hypothetical protein
MNAMWRRWLLLVGTGCTVAVVIGLVVVKLRNDRTARMAKLGVCREWEKVARDRLAAGKYSAARGALVSARTTCAYAELDDQSASADEDANVRAIERLVTDKEKADAEKDRAAAAATAASVESSASAPTVPAVPLSPSERVRVLAGIAELRGIIRRQMTAQGHESEDRCQARLDAETPRVKPAEAKVGLATMGVRVEDNSHSEGAPRVVPERRGLDATGGASSLATRFDEFVWACIGCWPPEDLADMREDRGCAKASAVLDEVAGRLTDAK